MLRISTIAGVWWLAALVTLGGCSSAGSPSDSSSPDARADGTSDDASSEASADAPTDAPPDGLGPTDSRAGADAQDAGPSDAGADGGASTLDWYPGNYGLVGMGNATARDAFLTGALASAFDGVEVIYPWTKCETSIDHYDACFTAIDGDLAATPAGKHLIIFLQYKTFGSGTTADGGSAVPDSVPAYLLTSPGAWCESSGGTPVCGEYTTATSSIAMIWNQAVADRVHAWIAALGAHYAAGGAGAKYADRIAGIVLPETATGETMTYPLATVGYTSMGYVGAIEDNLTAAATAFPTKPVFQYINFLAHGVPSESAALQSIGTWALGLKPRHIGLGCPDVGGNSSFHPFGYDTLMNATYQLHLPFNVAIEPMDFDKAITTGLDATYAEAIGPAPGGMAAQFVVWWYEQGTGHVFNIDDVAAYLPGHPDPNTALPK
jgi:hypothetical protein